MSESCAMRKPSKALGSRAQHDALVRGLNLRALIQHPIGAGGEGGGADGHGRPGKKVAARRREQGLALRGWRGEALSGIPNKQLFPDDHRRRTRQSPQTPARKRASTSERGLAAARLEGSGGRVQGRALAKEQIESHQGEVNAPPQSSPNQRRADWLRMNF